MLPQNTYTNAEKLLAAAEELARSGECDPEEVLGVARELEAHVAAFAARVDRRRRRLDLAVLLYTHEKEASLTCCTIFHDTSKVIKSTTHCCPVEQVVIDGFFMAHNVLLL